MKKCKIALLVALALLIAFVPCAYADKQMDLSGLDALMVKKQAESVEGGKAAQLAGLTGGSQQVTVGYIVEGLAQYQTKDDGEISGFDIEVVKKILQSANYKNYTFVEISEQDALTLLDSEEITLVMGLTLDDSKVSRVVEISRGNELALADKTEDQLTGQEEEIEVQALQEGKYFKTTSYLSGEGRVTLKTGETADLQNKDFYLIGTNVSGKLIDAFDRAYEKVYVSGYIDKLWAENYETGFFYDLWRSVRRIGFSIWRQFRMNLIEEDRYKMIFTGLGRTILIAVVSSVIGVAVGCILALMRLSNLKIGKWKALQSISSIYVDIIRGTPVVVQLMIMYYVILTSPNISKITVAIITFGLNSAAYVSEMVRGGILAVDKGQTEAGRSLGLSAASTMLLIVLPQTIKIIIPSLFNEIIMLLKETSVVGFIGLMDLTKAGDFIRSRTYSAFFPLLIVAAVYLIIVTTLTRVFNVVERRLRQSDIR